MSAAEHIIDEVEQPIFVKEIKGRIVNSPDSGNYGGLDNG